MRIQKSICDECGKEVMSEDALRCEGIVIRIGHDMASTYLHDSDFCSVECLAQACEKSFKQVSKRLNKKVKE